MRRKMKRNRPADRSAMRGSSDDVTVVPQGRAGSQPSSWPLTLTAVAEAEQLPAPIPVQAESEAVSSLQLAVPDDSDDVAVVPHGWQGWIDYGDAEDQSPQSYSARKTYFTMPNPDLVSQVQFQAAQAGGETLLISKDQLKVWATDNTDKGQGDFMYVGLGPVKGVWRGIMRDSVFVGELGTWPHITIMDYGSRIFGPQSERVIADALSHVLENWTSQSSSGHLTCWFTKAENRILKVAEQCELGQLMLHLRNAILKYYGLEGVHLDGEFSTRAFGMAAKGIEIHFPCVHFSHKLTELNYFGGVRKTFQRLEIKQAVVEAQSRDKALKWTLAALPPQPLTMIKELTPVTSQRAGERSVTNRLGLVTPTSATPMPGQANRFAMPRY